MAIEPCSRVSFDTTITFSSQRHPLPPIIQHGTESRNGHTGRAGTRKTHPRPARRCRQPAQAATNGQRRIGKDAKSGARPRAAAEGDGPQRATARFRSARAGGASACLTFRVWLSPRIAEREGSVVAASDGRRGGSSVGVCDFGLPLGCRAPFVVLLLLHRVDVL